MAETLEKKHERIMLRFDRAYSPQKEVREKCIEATRFARVPGGQWEGATAAGTKLDEQFEKYPKFEINKVATELNRIIAEYRNNRITVKFRPGDREASEELANKLNGLFRADYEETDGGEACDNAFDDAATGGFGCFRLTSMLVNEYDPMDDRQRIAIEPIYDPSRSVWFDPDAKKYDKSDALWAFCMYSLSPEKYEAEYGKKPPTSLDVTSMTSWEYNWFGADVIYIAKYYEVRKAMMSWLQNNSSELTRAGVDPLDVAKMYQQNPQGFTEFVDHLGMAALGPEQYFQAQDRIVGREIDRGKLAETIRSNQAGEALTARGQNITMRGQDLSMQRASMKGSVGNNERTVQLADGRTVTVGGKLHGAGANAFYEGIDNEGNMVRVPAGSIAAPATSAASAQNYAMKKDLDAISGASIDDLGFMTGITGSSGSPALGADIRSRASGGDQRKLYNAAQRIQGKMQNQGIAAARDMGASGINTVAEAKMYFQGMPQVDFSSPEALQQSMRDIQQYTDNYNQQYNVNVGNGGKKSSMQQPPTQQSAGGSYTSKSGIQFTVE
ncbi:TPA: phage DNA ejection protein [Escherichia coli]|nr:phage DNA ejection protein [Escherichia coli]ELZ5413807.1 phage DNA ejection protein [Escherichia coli]HCT9663862.1 phage DNA ejection protein [Escherichia coli]